MRRISPPTLPEAGTAAYQRGWLILQVTLTPFWIQKAKVLAYQRLWILRTNGFSNDDDMIPPAGNDLLAYRIAFWSWLILSIVPVVRNCTP
jgi:hypothetical protein